MPSPLDTPYVYTPGPVKMHAAILAEGGRQTPYFRNADFSAIVLECENRLLHLAHAAPGSRAIFLTASGTAAMEAVVTNLLTPARPVAVINGGAFGQRFSDLCAYHGLDVHEQHVDRDTLSNGQALSMFPGHEQALLINAHETSIGHCYDLSASGRWCQAQNALHIVDGISLFITDPIDMQAQHIDALILSSQKGLALPPGLSIVLLSPRAQAHLQRSASYYMDFRRHLADGERGQTPFTPAVSIILQLHQRLAMLAGNGLVEEQARAARVAACLRNGLSDLPLRPYSTSMPNAMTAIEVVPPAPDAIRIVRTLEQDYGYMVAPNGGDLRDRLFRVSHMGAVDVEDMENLLQALRHIIRRFS